ncbi:MAG: DUF1543 domain-containing protein [Bacteroidota bacterium]|nr:DUF1543 domain-containing protein [Bacteroidota bacterium]
MLLVGCRPKGRHTEQHDVIFSVATSIKALVPEIIACWPEAKGVIHVDAWREVHWVDGYRITVQPFEGEPIATDTPSMKLFFINLGGYKKNEFEEFHYKMVVAAANKSEAIKKARKTAFFKHTGFNSAPAHVDDKYGIDVDELYDIKEMLSARIKKEYTIRISPSNVCGQDELHLGYFKLNNL